MIPRLVCIVRTGLVRAELRRSGRTTWAAEAEWDSLASLREVIAHLAGRAELPLYWRRARFEVGEELLQRRTLHGIPPVSRDALAGLIALAPARYFRRGRGELVTDARWLGRGPARQGIAVAVDRGIVEALLAGAREAGLLVTGIRPAGGAGARGLLLLPNDEQARRRAADLRWTLRLGAAAVCAWLLLGAGLLFAELRERRRLDARLAEIDQPLAAILAVESQVDSVRRMVDRLDEEGAMEGSVAATLFRLTAALPDSSFLTQLRIDSAGMGLAAGAARRPATVLAAIEGRAGVANPRFEGRTTRDVVAGRPVERFSIGFGPTGTPQ